MFAKIFAHAWSWCGGLNEELSTYIYQFTLKAKLNLAPLGMPNRIWSSISRYRKFSVQTSTTTKHAQKKLTQHKIEYCLQNKQLSTKTPFEVKSNLNVNNISSSRMLH